MKIISRVIVLFFLTILLLVGCGSPEERVANFIVSGNQYLDQRQFVDADLQFRNALQIDAKAVDAWYGLAKIAEQQAEWKNAFKFFSKVVQLDPKHVVAHVFLGKIHLAAGDIEKAFDKSELILGLAPENADARALKAAVLFRQGETLGAVKEAKLALKKDPGHAAALLVLATERLTSGDPSAAINYLDQGIGHDEKNVGLQLVKASALNQQKKVDQAALVFNRLIEFYPDNRAFRHSLAKLYIANDMLDEAQRIFLEVVNKSPGDVDAKLNVIRFLLAYRDFEQAEKQLKAFIETWPKMYRLQFSLAELYIKHEQIDNAKVILSHVLEKDGNGSHGLQAKSRLALLALAEKNIELASKQIDEILVVEPRNTSALLLKSDLLLKENHVSKAITNLRMILRDQPNFAKARHMLAKSHLQAGSVELAKNNYLKAIQADQENIKLELEYIQLLIRTKETDQAENRLQDLLLRIPKNVQALHMLAQVKLSKQQWDIARDLAKKIKSYGGPEALADQITGIAFQGKQQYGESISAFKKAHQALPMAIQPLMALVQTYVRAGKHDEAEGFLESVLKSNDQNITASMLLGRLYLTNKKIAQAEKVFRKAIKTHPTNILGYRNLAALLVSHENSKEAESVLQDGIVKTAPNNQLLQISLASVQQQAGDYDQAIETYEVILEQDPKADVVANNLASLLSDHRKDKASLDRALQLAKRFKDVQTPHFKDTLGWVHYQMGNLDQAMPLLLDAADALPEFSDFRYHVGMGYLAKEQRDKAKQELEKAISFSAEDSATAIQAKKALNDL